jgi:nucleotide-binding universal stress UspA family protein
MTSAKAKVLVVANRTAGSEELLSALRERAEEGPATFHLVVPATPHGVSWAADMHSGSEAAEHDLEGALRRLRDLGIECDGEVGDPDPIAAVQDSANFGDYDEVVVSTLPKHLSRWLRLDLPRRVAHATGLPVKHVVAAHASVPA